MPTTGRIRVCLKQIPDRCIVCVGEGEHTCGEKVKKTSKMNVNRMICMRQAHCVSELDSTRATPHKRYALVIFVAHPLPLASIHPNYSSSPLLRPPWIIHTISSGLAHPVHRKHRKKSLHFGSAQNVNHDYISII